MQPKTINSKSFLGFYLLNIFNLQPISLNTNSLRIASTSSFSVLSSGTVNVLTFFSIFLTQASTEPLVYLSLHPLSLHKRSFISPLCSLARHMVHDCTGRWQSIHPREDAKFSSDLPCWQNGPVLSHASTDLASFIKRALYLTAHALALQVGCTEKQHISN